MNKLFLFFLACLIATLANAQELRARVNVLSSRVGNSVDKKTFQTLQTALNNFINNRKWSSDNYAPNEKIDCSFLLNLESTSDANVYKGSLTIQSSRPVFNSAYLSPVINYQDNDIIFKYIEFQQLEFNDTRVSGTDALVSNLTAVIAYWINMVLGFDYDSFSARGGNVYFQKAQNIVNNAPESGSSIPGWKAVDGTRNRVLPRIMPQQGILHRLRRNKERLNEEWPDDKEDEYPGDDQRLEDFRDPSSHRVHVVGFAGAGRFER